MELSQKNTVLIRGDSHSFIRSSQRLHCPFPSLRLLTAFVGESPFFPHPLSSGPPSFPHPPPPCLFNLGCYPTQPPARPLPRHSLARIGSPPPPPLHILSPPPLFPPPPTLRHGGVGGGGEGRGREISRYGSGGRGGRGPSLPRCGIRLFNGQSWKGTK